jgi:hypothetical protein
MSEMNMGLSRANAEMDDCFFCMGVEADGSDELDDGDDENSVEMESLEPLAAPLPELLASSGPKQLNTTGR